MRYRYPGVFPFDTSQEDLFCGRDTEADKLYMLIMSNKTVTLHANSGTGKSSLINAALLPELRNDSEFISIPIRFRGIKKSQSRNMDLDATDPALINEVIEDIRKYVSDAFPDIPYLMRNEEDLWYWAKVIQYSGKSFLFIFDQFENIESYQSAQINFFKEKLAQLFSPHIPNEYNNYFLEQSPLSDKEFLSDPENRSRYNMDSDFIRRPLNTKAVFVIREDKLGVLSYFSDSFPDILKKEYQLQALSKENAKLAINNPAKMQGEFFSPRFEFDDNAMDFLLRNLLDKDTQTIDPIEIQIICSHVEKKVTADFAGNRISAHPETQIISIPKDYLPPINDIVSNFYNDCWHNARAALKTEIPSDADFMKSQKEIVSELVVNGKRIPVFGFIFQHNEFLIIKQLMKLGLIRKRTIEKETFFQLCHDRFITPLLENLKVIAAKDEFESNLKLYGKLLREFESDENHDVYKIKVLVEEHLIADRLRIRIPINEGIQLTSEQTIAMLIDKRLLTKADSNSITYIEITDDGFLAPILKENEVRLAREEKERQAKMVNELELAARNKKIKDQKRKNARLVVLLGILAIVAIVTFVQRGNEKKQNEQTPYLMAAIRTQNTNPTLTYIIARTAYETYQDNEQLNSIIAAIEKQYPIQLVDRKFISGNIIGASFIGKNQISIATPSDILAYGKQFDKVISRDNNNIFASARNSRHTFYFRYITDISGDRVEVVKNTGESVAKFIVGQDNFNYTVAVSENEALFFIKGYVYQKGQPLPINHYYDAQKAAFITDNYVATSNDYSGQVSICNLKGEVIKSSPVDYNYRSYITSLVVTADGNYLISGDTRSDIHIWETNNLGSKKQEERMIPLRKLVGHSAAVNDIALSADNKWIVSGSDDETAIVWDFNGRIKTILRGHSKPVDFVQFSVNGKNILTSSKQGEVFLWEEGQIKDLYKNKRLPKFSRFEFRALGILKEYLIPDDYLYIKDVNGFAKNNLKQQIMILNDYCGTLPEENAYPEVENYNKGIIKSIENQETRYKGIFKKKEFKALPAEYKRMALIPYAILEYRKPDLLFKYEPKDKAEARQLTFCKNVISAHLIDTTGFVEVSNYLLDMINIGFDYDHGGDKHYNESARQEIADYVRNVLSAYIKKQPSLAVRAAGIVQSIAVFYSWKEDPEKYALYTEQILSYSGYAKNDVGYMDHYFALHDYAAAGKLENAKQMIDRMWNATSNSKSKQELKIFLTESIFIDNDKNTENLRKLAAYIKQKK